MPAAAPGTPPSRRRNTTPGRWSGSRSGCAFVPGRQDPKSGPGGTGPRGARPAGGRLALSSQHRPCGDRGLEPGLLTLQRECPSQHERAPHQLLRLCYDRSHFTDTAWEAQRGQVELGGGWGWALSSGPSDQTPCPGRHSPAHGWCCGRRRTLRSQRRGRPPGRGEQRGWGLAERVYQHVPTLPNRGALHAGTRGTPSSSPEWPCL